MTQYRLKALLVPANRGIVAACLTGRIRGPQYGYCSYV